MMSFHLAFGLFHSFLESTFPGQAIVVMLLVGSAFGWTAMVARGNRLKHVKQESARFYSAFDHEPHPLGLFLKGHRFSECPAYRVYLRGCEAACRVLAIDKADPLLLERGLQLSGDQILVIREAAERELADQVLNLETDMQLIATITTAAPFLGLLGTVWGVMEAFAGMAVTGTPTLSAVAPGISAALLTTVVGLLVALPSLIGYNWLADSLRKQTVAMDNFVQKLSGEFHLNCATED